MLESVRKKLEEQLPDVFIYLVPGEIEETINYFMVRCEEDPGLAEDILQEHKTMNKCYAYCAEQIKERKTVVAVGNMRVYEWMEDYFRKDDKAEEEAAKAKLEKEKEERELNIKKAVEKKQMEQLKEIKKKEQETGQISLFDLV